LFLRGIRIRFYGGELRASAFSFGSAGSGPNGLMVAVFVGEVKLPEGLSRTVGAEG